MLAKILDFLNHLTWKRYILGTVAVFTAIVAYTLYENRQEVYHTSFPVMKGDYELEMPSVRGRKLIDDFMKRYPEVGMLTIIDADPVKNRRVPVYRAYNSAPLRQIIEDNFQAGRDGSGPLFSSDNDANQQVLTVLSGEMKCEPVEKGIFTQLMPGVGQAAVYSCRIPIPPAFQYVTGWISIHFSTWPPNRSLDMLKQDALSLGSEYYAVEIGR